MADLICSMICKHRSKRPLRKWRIFERLQLFRGANGLGCLRRISDKCTFGITDDLLRDILTGNASPTIKEWREIGRALDELEGKGAASE